MFILFLSIFLVANWGLAEGLKRKQVVALMMDNRPEFIFTWLGLCKIGVITSLINTNLKGAPLQNSLYVCKATHYIIGNEHLEVIKPLMKGGATPLHGIFYSSGAPCEGFLHLDPILLTHTSATIPSAIRAGLLGNDELFYIYTSGTTGNPKASVIKHLRFYSCGIAFCEALNITTEDVVYCTLPLYHSAGGMIGVSMAWYNAVPLVLRRKFSASQFWTDCRKHNCTVIQYIGELCRYLLTAPPSHDDTTHK
jgi:acyl-CoA synthetase (AMP-forming)/AMP-acid ligase II